MAQAGGGRPRRRRLERRTSTKGIVTQSVVVFVVRKGNPKGIKTWADLVRPGVEVIEPNPFTSGGAKWNIMAAYGAQLQAGQDATTQAEAYLADLFKHVPVQDKSAREALQTFVGGKGDVLLSYENEAIAAQQAGRGGRLRHPRRDDPHREPARGDRGQRARLRGGQGLRRLPLHARGPGDLRAKGYRPVVAERRDGVDRSRRPRQLFTIADLGGWSEVNKTLLRPRRQRDVDASSRASASATSAK